MSKWKKRYKKLKRNCSITYLIGRYIEEGPIYWDDIWLKKNSQRKLKSFLETQ